MSNLFIYEKPFVVKDSYNNQQKYLSETVRLTTEERADELTLQRLILKFIIDNGLGILNNETLTPSVNSETGSWIYLLNWMNFRSLVDQHEHVKLINALKSDNQFGVNEILNLHMRIGAMFDHKLLNTVCHRVMTSVGLIPYTVPKDHTKLSWEEIHEETPFIWLIILIQSVLKNDSRKLG